VAVEWAVRVTAGRVTVAAITVSCAVAEVPPVTVAAGSAATVTMVAGVAVAPL